MPQTDNATREDGAAVNFQADIGAYTPPLPRRQHGRPEFATAPEAALALLAKGVGLNRYSGRFCGQIIGDPLPLTAKQQAWLQRLLEAAELPPFVGGGHA